LASIRDPNPVVFFEPKVEFKYSSSITVASEYLLCFAETKTTSPVFLKWLYRLAVDEVPEEDYMLPLSQAEVSIFLSHYYTGLLGIIKSKYLCKLYT